MEVYNRVVAEIDLDAIENNIKEIRRYVEDKEIMAIVKADAYGHGAMEVSKTLLSSGADRLAVAILEEAVQMRKNGIDKPIMILGYTPPNFSEDIVKNDIIQTVFSLDMAEIINKVAYKRNTIAKIHIKIDTGMGRIGFLPNKKAIEDIVKINNMSNIEIEGIFTHLSSADEEDREYTNNQIKLFKNFINKLESNNVYIKYKHISNSAGLIDYNDSFFNMVRPGIIMYGLYPSEYVSRDKLKLREAMSLKTHIIYIKELEKDKYISYGRTYKTNKKTLLATIPVGYGDGYNRKLSSKGRVIINGEYANITGRICMDQFMIDITGIDASVGDEVILFGEKGKNKISVDELAKIIGTINYEVICSIGKRIPRVYKKNGEFIKIIKYLK